MARKKINEFAASDGTNVAPDPVDVGDAHGLRPADKNNGEPIPDFASKAEALHAMMTLMQGFPTNQIGDIFKGLTDIIKPGQGHAGRGADQNAGETGQVVTPGSTPPAVRMESEDLEAMFAGETLSEDLKIKAKTVFEAALGAKLVLETARIEEEYAELLEEAVADAVENMTEAVDRYLTYVAEEFVTENALAIESGVRAEISENFMNGLRNLFAENYIEVPEERVDVMAELVDELDALEEKYNATVAELLEYRKTGDKAAIAEAVAELTKGMVLTQAAKLKTLSEGIEYKDLAEFKQKFGILKETYFPTGAKKSGGAEQLNEVLDLVEDKPRSNDPMDAYVDVIARTAKA